RSIATVRHFYLVVVCVVAVVTCNSMVSYTLVRAGTNWNVLCVNGVVPSLLLLSTSTVSLTVAECC
ncbi:hypothetical protein RRG08_066380, partial [Elysia crispata]